MKYLHKQILLFAIITVFSLDKSVYAQQQSVIDYRFLYNNHNAKKEINKKIKLSTIDFAAEKFVPNCFQ